MAVSMVKLPEICAPNTQLDSPNGAGTASGPPLDG
jgi:hypothetical protein